MTLHLLVNVLVSGLCSSLCMGDT